MTAPDWLKNSALTPCRSGAYDIKNKKGFVEKGLEEISSFLMSAVFQEEYARKEGLMQGIDARIKLISILFLIVLTSFTTSFQTLLLFYSAAILLAALSKIELKFFIARVWIFIPLFAGVVALPSVLSAVTPGKVLVGTTIRGHEISVTYEGVRGASVFVLRVAVSVSFAVLLTLTTKWSALLRALSMFRVPSIFILTLEMAYRYIFLLIKTANEMHLAKKSRTIKKESAKDGQKWVASGIAALFRKSYHLSEEVHKAMLSRGYRAK